MQWTELDLVAGTWTLPRERVKNDRRHEVPLARQAIAVINGVPRIGDKYVFTLSGTAATNNFKAKKCLNQLAGIEAWDLARPAPHGRQWHGQAWCEPSGDRKGSEPRLWVVGRHRGCVSTP